MSTTIRYEEMRGLKVPKLGAGTWSLGGDSRPDPSRDRVARAALRVSLEIGYRHFDTAEKYAAGHTEELLGEAVRDSRVPRDELFITTKISAEHLAASAVARACRNSLSRLQMEYVDLYLIHWPRAGMDLAAAFKALNTLVHDGMVRHLGVSNFNLPLLKKAQSLSSTPLLTNQVPYSLHDRSYRQNGVLEYCQRNELLLTAYSPLDQGNFRLGHPIQDIADAHAATPYQVALAWLIAQPRVITIPMSADPRHLQENWEAQDISLTPLEMERLSGP